jgi:hypothetical protein
LALCGPTAPPDNWQGPPLPCSLALPVLMAIIADFMLVWLPAPTFALGAPQQVRRAWARARRAGNRRATRASSASRSPGRRAARSRLLALALRCTHLSQSAAANPLARLFSGCPDNAFQKVQPGMAPFTLAQRLGAPVRNGLKLFCVGTGARWARRRGWGGGGGAEGGPGARVEGPSD